MTDPEKNQAAQRAAGERIADPAQEDLSEGSTRATEQHSADGSDTAETGAEDSQLRKARRDAADYRTRLRAAEDRVAAMQRREIERLAGEKLAQGSDVFLAAQLPDLLDADTGDVDPAKVDERAGAVVRDRPGLAKGAGGFPDLGQGQREPARTVGASWHEVVKGQPREPSSG